MCYLARHSAAQPEERAAPSVPGSGRARSRWAGAAAAALVAGFALAALVTPSPTAPSLPKEKAAVAPAVVRPIEMPTAATVERIVLGDDGLAARPDNVRAGVTPCAESL